MADEKKICPTCGGSGEIGFFQGESRFFITREECPNCCGVGTVNEDDEPDPPPDNASDSKLQNKTDE